MLAGDKGRFPEPLCQPLLSPKAFSSWRCPQNPMALHICSDSCCSWLLSDLPSDPATLAFSRARPILLAPLLEFPALHTEIHPSPQHIHLSEPSPALLPSPAPTACRTRLEGSGHGWLLGLCLGRASACLTG